MSEAAAVGDGILRELREKAGNVPRNAKLWGNAGLARLRIARLDPDVVMDPIVESCYTRRWMMTETLRTPLGSDIKSCRRAGR